jgi:hypothetical protein
MSALNRTAALLAASLVLTVGPAGAGNDERKVIMYDDCNQEDYDARFGPGVCVGHGNTTFPEFADELVTTGTVTEWKFQHANGGTHVDGPGLLVIPNEGGLLHTFTRVAEFGGGFNAAFNQFSNNPVPAPECAITLPDGRLTPVPPNATNLFIGQDGLGFIATGPGSPLPAGEHHFQCCIHPWMRVTVEVREDEND